MFNRKLKKDVEKLMREVLPTDESHNWKQHSELHNRIDKLSDTIHGTININPYSPDHGKLYGGFDNRISLLEKENKKLKCIVAELVDYVYGDKKGGN